VPLFSDAVTESDAESDGDTSSSDDDRLFDLDSGEDGGDMDVVDVSNIDENGDDERPSKAYRTFSLPLVGNLPWQSFDSTYQPHAQVSFKYHVGFSNLCRESSSSMSLQDIPCKGCHAYNRSTGPDVSLIPRSWPPVG
jgi:hypothetical protein